MSAPTEEQALAFAKYHAEHAAHGGAGREFHLRAETFLLELARVSAERDAAVKEKLAALAKVKALHQKIADAYRLMKAARDDGCVWPANWHGCGTGQDCNCRPMRELAKAARAALASEVPPQPTTPATPTDKEKTR